MKPLRFKKNLTKRGSALFGSFVVLALLGAATSSYMNNSMQTVKLSLRQQLDITSTHLCEAGTQAVLRDLWRPFKTTQKFDDLDTRTADCSEEAPKIVQLGTIPNVGKYAAGVVAVQDSADGYSRIVTIRAVAWFDRDNDDVLDTDEARKTVDVNAKYELARSQVFDYTYFVNNYGWMDGFGQNDLIVNGDMRANGNMDFLNGSPTINGSIYGSVNEKLTPKAVGLINTGPVKWSNATYKTNVANEPRARRVYESSFAGEKGSDTYEAWRDFLFDTSGGIYRGRSAGSTLNDSTGTKTWTRESAGATATPTMLDSTPTKEIIMPDLSDLNTYKSMSQTYQDTRAKFTDGTANANYGQGAWVDVYNSTTRAYQRITTNGVLTGSAILIGSEDRPIKIHGPVTFTQDVVIKGYVSGQGTIYAGRNAHIVGSLQYKSGPDFRGTNQTTIDNANEKKDFLGLAARGSVIFGNPAGFGNPYPLKYMTPPFTKGRYDEAGNWIPPYNATETDSTGFKKYQSVLGDAALNAIASGINQVDAVIYTNFCGGGNLGTGGGGVKFNGTIISRDEAMVIWSLPIVMNYDNRARERAMSKTPLIDLSLPRSPVLLQSTWQDRGFQMGTHETARTEETEVTAIPRETMSESTFAEAKITKEVSGGFVVAVTAKVKSLMATTASPRSERAIEVAK